MAQIFLGQKEAENSKEDEMEAKRGSFPTFNFKRERTYLIIATDVNDSEDQILANPNIPQLGTTETLGIPVKSRTAKEISTVARHPITGVRTILWEVTISGDSQLTYAAGGSQIIEEITALVEWDVEDEDVHFERDVITGVPLVNSNLEPIFDEREASYPVAKVTRFEPYPADPNLFLSYHNTINKSVFWGAAPKSVKLKIKAPIEINEQEGVIFCKTEYWFYFKVGDFDDEPWCPRYLNEGYYVKSDPLALPALNKVQGEKTKVNLALDGTALPEGAAPVWLKYNKYRVVEWYGLNLHLPDDYPDGPPS